MALNIHYIGNYTFRQIGPPQWDKTYLGEPDRCTIVYQGAQYLLTTFLNALSKYQTMVTIAGLSVVDESGASAGDSSMFLTKFSNDDSAIWPKVTLTFVGCRGGTTPDPRVDSGKTLQSVSSTKVISIDTTSPNFGKAITMSITYYAAYSKYQYVSLSNPAGVSAYTTVANPISYTYTLGTLDPNFVIVRFSGMVDANGNPSNTISTADATEVWNTFGGTNQVSDFSADRVVGTTSGNMVFQCSATVQFLLIGTG